MQCQAAAGKPCLSVQVERGCEMRLPVPSLENRVARADESDGERAEQVSRTWELSVPTSLGSYIGRHGTHGNLPCL